LLRLSQAILKSNFVLNHSCGQPVLRCAL
jgi:hypothetical protein